MQFVPVGEQICLFRGDNHAVALLQPEAARVCAELLAADSVPSAIGIESSPAIAAMLRQLADGGFLDQECGSAAKPRNEAGSHPPALAALSRTCQLLPERPVSIHVEAACLARLIGAAIGPLAGGLLAGDMQSGIAATIAVEGQDAAFTVRREGCVIADNLAAADARRIALQALLMAMLPDGATAAILHASCIAYDDRAIVLAGATGSGKSTLAAYLAATGAEYLADDFTALCQDGTVARYPLAVSIKEPSWGVLEALLPQLRHCQQHRLGERVVRYVPLQCPIRSTGATALPVEALVLPRFEPSRPSELERLAPEEAFGNLLTTGTEIVGAPRSIAPLAALVNERPAWRLSYRDLAEARDLIGRLR